LTGRTFAEDLSARATEDPDRIALITPDTRVSCAELDRRASAVAQALGALGVSRGDTVAVVYPNGVDAAVAIYGVLRAGAAFSPVNPSTKRDRLALQLADLGASAVLCAEPLTATVRAAAAEAVAVAVVSDLERMGAEGPSTPPALEIDLGAVIYTSGSTGEPKGVTLSHRNMTFVADSIIEYLRLGRDDRILCVLPLSFNYGLYQLLMAVRVGATLVLEPGFAFPGRIVSLLADERITCLPGVPTVFTTLLSLHGLRERRFPDLRLLTNAGAALPAATVADVRATFPDAELFLMYGLTEATRVAYLPPELVDSKPTAVGTAIPGTEAWIEDEAGRVLGPGEVGELFVRGAHVMEGYWNDPDGTAKRLREGRWPWERTLATNDLFRLDDDGHLRFVGRRDDVIKSRGEKVAPREVEEVLVDAPGVREAAVVGVEDRLLGMAVIAHVAPEPEAELDPAELRRICAGALEDHKVPRRIDVHDELPRTANGKIDRRALAGASAARPAD
jgi:amino acid adenylation domain-containing protein